jgi:hypothetical protein
MYEATATRHWFSLESEALKHVMGPYEADGAIGHCARAGNVSPLSLPCAWNKTSASRTSEERAGRAIPRPANGYLAASAIVLKGISSVPALLAVVSKMPVRR